MFVPRADSYTTGTAGPTARIPRSFGKWFRERGFRWSFPDVVTHEMFANEARYGYSGVPITPGLFDAGYGGIPGPWSRSRRFWMAHEMP